MKSVVGYCRTGYALGSDPTANATRQAQEIERYAECQGLTIHETYMDPGVSGITLDRPESSSLATPRPTPPVTPRL